jgi:putative endonuclease
MKTMYVYILKCVDGSYYTGVTNNLEKRYEEHKSGIDIYCYTFSRRPLELVFYEMFNNPNDAIAFEKKLKGWTRQKKEALVYSDWNKIKELAICKNKTSHIYNNKDVFE